MDALFPHAISQPVMLVQADTRREWKVGTHADEHSSPACVVDVEVVLDHPALDQLQMPAIILLVTVGAELEALPDDRPEEIRAKELAFRHHEETTE